MQRILLMIASLLVIFALPTHADEQDWVGTSNAYAQKVLAMRAEFQPEVASMYGLMEYDNQVMELGEKSEKRQLNAAKAMTRTLTIALSKETDLRVKQDIEILLESLAQEIEGIELTRKYTLAWTNVPELVFQSLATLLSEQAAPERRSKALERLEKYVGLHPDTTPLTEQAKAHFNTSLKTAKTGPYRGELEDATGKYSTYVAGIRALFAQYAIEGADKALDTLATQVADYGQWTQEKVMPLARENFREPAALYAYRLKTVGIQQAPEELLVRAQREFYATRAAMQALAPKVAEKLGLDATDYVGVIKGMKKTKIPDSALEATYHEANAHLEALIKKHRVVSLPSTTLKMRLSTKAEAAAQPAPHMSPPPLVGNTGQQGVFILPVSVSDSTAPEAAYDDFNFSAAKWTLSAHEARPGHELQFDAMIANGVSQARAIFAFNSVNVEGWALYAEAEMLPYEPAEGQLIALQFRLLRAARAFLDPMLNLGMITKADAERILLEEVVLSPAMTKQEVDRYTFRYPGQANAYFYGYSKLIDIRMNAEIALKDNFDRKAFNDFILTQGLLPPELLAKAVNEVFIPQHRKP